MTRLIGLLSTQRRGSEIRLMASRSRRLQTELVKSDRGPTNENFWERQPVLCGFSALLLRGRAARAHEVEKRHLLHTAHWDFAAREEHHRCVLLEILGRKFRQVFRCDDLEGTGSRSKLRQDCPGKRDDVVPIASRVGEIENAFGRALRASGQIAAALLASAISSRRVTILSQRLIIKSA